MNLIYGVLTLAALIHGLSYARHLYRSGNIAGTAVTCISVLTALILSVVYFI